MPSVDVLKPYVEKVIKDYVETDSLYIDDDGDIPIRSGSGIYYVRVVDGDPPVVRLFSNLVDGIKETYELLQYTNQMNKDVKMAQVFVDGERIVACIDLVAETLDKEEVEVACAAMAAICDRYDDEIVAKFGGSKVFSDDGESEDRPADV